MNPSRSDTENCAEFSHGKSVSARACPWIRVIRGARFCGFREKNMSEGISINHVFLFARALRNGLPRGVCIVRKRGTNRGNRLILSSGSSTREAAFSSRVHDFCSHCSHILLVAGSSSNFSDGRVVSKTHLCSGVK